ncbi:hypothetical protein [Desulfovibrio inopinatus]|uniref:hypothetical protein n=1 Tax=Desulfovibrio inopinatus TaxID=102109 RepID=UPI000420DF8C|nr:hypothetical protein [Desulfovibrio inopinatus]
MRYISRDRLTDILFGALFAAVMVMMCVMAMTSRLNAHPDELHHVDSGRYYMKYWDPPSIGDERTIFTFSKYGVSYLYQLDVVYFLAGKFAKLTSAFFPHDYQALRFFNIGLFFILILLFYRLPRQRRIAFVPLLLTPQLWYVFSYFNGDAFPFFLAYVCVYMLCRDRYTVPPAALSLKDPFFRKLLFLGMVIGLMAVSKRNYYVFLCFLLALFGENAYFDHALKPILKNLAVVVAICLTLVTLRVGLDAYVNKSVNQDALSHYAETFAKNEFKPSKVYSGEAYFGYNMREQGLSYSELFTKWNWHIWTFRTSYGVYDYMKIYAPYIYYRWVGYALIAFLLVQLVPLAFSSTEHRWMLATLVFFSGVTIFQSTWHSWISDFQAQGRYLFPILPMLGLSLAQTGRASLSSKPLTILLTLILFGFGTYSFIWIGLANIAKG